MSLTLPEATRRIQLATKCSYRSDGFPCVRNIGCGCIRNAKLLIEASRKRSVTRGIANPRNRDQTTPAR